MQSTNLVNISNPKKLKIILNQLIDLVNNPACNSRINEIIEIINELSVIVNSLKGAMVSLGQINFKTEDITQQLLNDFVSSLGKVLQSGFVVYDLDDNEWEYNGEEWVNNGKFINMSATNTQLGIVKGGNDYVSILNGIITVLKSQDAEKLGGELPEYYASLNALTTLQSDLEAILSAKVNKVDNKGLSTNDLTDILKSNYNTAYSQSHLHSNKAILDNTTASFTSEEKTKLSEVVAGVEQYNSKNDFPNIGTEKTIYVDKTANKSYRFDVSTNIYIIVGSDYEDIVIINCQGGN